MCGTSDHTNDTADAGANETGEASPADRWPGARDLSVRASDLGMATAEYAIATLAACGFAGLLLTLLKSGEVKGLLFGIVRRALSV